MTEFEKAFEAAEKLDRVKMVGAERVKRILENDGHYCAVPIFIPVRQRIETGGQEQLVRLGWACLTPENMNKTGQGDPIRNSYANYPDEESALDSVALHEFARRNRTEQNAIDNAEDAEDGEESEELCGIAGADKAG